MELIEQALNLLITLTMLILAGIAAMRVSKRIGLPDVVLLLLVGVLVGPVLGLISIPTDSLVNQVILLGGAAYILFHGGTDVDFEVMAKVWKTIALLAIAGVLLAAAITGAVAAQLLGMSFLLAFLLATVMVPTDPATLIPVFDQVKIRPKVAQTVIAESTFNDATGASLVFVLAPVALGLEAFSLTNGVGTFLAQAGIGVLIGLAIGLIYVVAVSERYKVLYEAASKLSIVAAISAFVIADKLGGSGFMAAFIAGLMIGNAGYMGLSLTHSVHVRLHHFMVSNSDMMRIFIFILLGSHVSFSALETHLWEGLAIVAVLIFVARPLAVLACTLPDRKARWEWREILFLFWTKETGVIPAALAGILVAMQVPQADVIASITFLTVLVTILLQASTAPLLAKKLGLMQEPDETRLAADT